jgi:hypothetical protein
MVADGRLAAFEGACMKDGGWREGLVSVDVVESGCDRYIYIVSSPSIQPLMNSRHSARNSGARSVPLRGMEG